MCETCQQWQLIEALQLWSLRDTPAAITWDPRPRAPEAARFFTPLTVSQPAHHFTPLTIYQPVRHFTPLTVYPSASSTWCLWPTTPLRPPPLALQPPHGPPNGVIMRRPRCYDSDSSSADQPRRVHPAYAMEPPLNRVPTLALYFHSVGSQVEPPNPDAEVPPGFRVLGYTANQRMIIERSHPWRRMAWQGFVQGLRVVGAIGIYLASGVVRCIYSALIRMYRFVTRFLCAIPRDAEDGPVHALAVSDQDPGPVSAQLFTPPDLCQVGGAGAPLTATNPAAAEYTRRTVSRVLDPIEDLSPRRMEDSSSDEPPSTDSSDDSEGEPRATAGAIHCVGPHLSRTPPA